MPMPACTVIRKPLHWLLLALLMAAALPAPAQQPLHDPRPLAFRDAAEEARFHDLAAQLRCVQCQNQSLADSNAQIAQDLRREVLQLMQQGLDDAQIKQFLVARYGEFVLLRPVFARHTLLLWLTPVLAILLGGLCIWRLARRRPAAPARNLSAAEEAEVAALLRRE